MSTTIKDLKEDKKELEAHIREKIAALQMKYEVKIEGVYVETQDLVDASNRYTNVHIEISI